MKKHCGIVIQTFMPYKQKILLFDRSYGIIEATHFQKRMVQSLHHGMFLEYTLTGVAGRYRCEDSVISAAPQSWILQDIVFFHHVLEVIRFFVVPAQQNIQLFDLLVLLYTANVKDFQKELFKKWLMCRLFAVLGIYPENHETFSSSFISLISSSFDTMVRMDHEVAVHAKECSRWLLGCIAYHPQCDALKTVFFLTRHE